MESEEIRMKKYPFLADRGKVWGEIVRYVKNDILEDRRAAGVSVEIGAGYCDFINQFPAERKICYEQNMKMKEYAASDVEFRCQDAVNLTALEENIADLIFASNFLEHLKGEEHDVLLPRIHASMKNQGRLILIQPNFRLCADNYFDDETHQTVFDDKSIRPFLERYGFDICKIIPGLLPFSMKSRLPKWPILVRMYLNSPIRPNAAQMYVVAKKR